MSPSWRSGCGLGPHPLMCDASFTGLETGPACFRNQVGEGVSPTHGDGTVCHRSEARRSGQPVPWHRQHGRAGDAARERGACRLTDGPGDGGRIEENGIVGGEAEAVTAQASPTPSPRSAGPRADLHRHPAGWNLVPASTSRRAGARLRDRNPNGRRPVASSGQVPPVRGRLAVARRCRAEGREAVGIGRRALRGFGRRSRLEPGPVPWRGRAPSDQTCRAVADTAQVPESQTIRHHVGQNCRAQNHRRL